MKKHLLICTLALLLALGCAACGGTAEKTETSTETSGIDVADLAFRSFGDDVGAGITEIPEGINKETIDMYIGVGSDIGVLCVWVEKDDAFSNVANILFSTGEGEVDAETLSEFEEKNDIDTETRKTRTEAKDAQGHTVYVYPFEEERELPEELLADREALKANLNALLQNLVVFELDFKPVAFTTTDMDGTTVNSKELFAQADYTLLNVWATTCSFCIEEMPDLQALNDEMENVQVVLILNDADSLDSEEAQTAAEILSTQQVTLPCLLHNEETDRLLPVSGYPTSYLVDSNGTVLSETANSKDTEEYMEWINAAIQ